MFKNPMTLYCAAAVALVLLLNVSSFRQFHFHAKIQPAAPVIGASAYNNPDKEETPQKKESTTTSTMLNFFGVPAFLLCLAVWFANKKSGLAEVQSKTLLFFGLSWLMYEVAAYVMMIGGIATIGLGLVVFPFLVAINMHLFLVLTCKTWHWKKNPGIIWGATLASLLVAVLPVWYYFKTTDMANLFSLSVVLWQLVAIAALSRLWNLNIEETVVPAI